LFLMIVVSLFLLVWFFFCLLWFCFFFVFCFFCVKPDILCAFGHIKLTGLAWDVRLKSSQARIGGVFTNPHIKYCVYIYYVYIYTIWLFNITMENCPFIDGLPIKHGDFPWLC
jgi:hypothetical protein